MRTCLAISAYLVLSLACTALQAGESARTKNVLLLIGDDHGLELGCYGNDQVQTPHLDGLAKRGVRFANAFATTASCSPSRSVVFTGLYNHTNGMYGLQHAAHNFASHRWVKGITALLKESGYVTGVVSKDHVQPVSVYPYDHRYPRVGRDPGRLAGGVKQFLAAAGEQPFYLVVGFQDSHRAREGFGNQQDYPNFKPVVYLPDNLRLPYFLPDAADARREFAEYYQSVTRMDQSVGRILEELKDAGRESDTLVIYISDNGVPFPGAKTTLYDAGVHLPMIVFSPESAEGGRVNQAMVSWVDIVPTILEWTGAKGPEYELPGRSVLPMLDQEQPKGWDRVFLSHSFHQITMYYPVRGVRTRRYKYLWNLAHELPFPFASDLYNSETWQGVLSRGDELMGQRSVKSFIQRPEEELYDIQNDPNELNNLVNDSAHHQMLLQLRQEAEAFQKRTKDPWLVRREDR